MCFFSHFDHQVSITRNSGQLKSIRVEECSASREEDKEAILAKIGGKDGGGEWCHDWSCVKVFVTIATQMLELNIKDSFPLQNGLQTDWVPCFF